MKKTVADTNAALVHEGKIDRFPQLRAPTGKRGRPGFDRLAGLPSSEVVYLDEVTGLAVQGPANLSRAEAIEVIDDATEVVALFDGVDRLVRGARLVLDTAEVLQ